MEILKYEIKGDNSDNYHNKLVTKCPVYSDVMIGSAFCTRLCKNKISHNKEKQQIECELKKIPKDFGIFS